MLCSNIDRDNGAHNHCLLCIAQVTKIGVLQVVNSNEDARNQNRENNHSTFPYTSVLLTLLRILLIPLQDITCS